MNTGVFTEFQRNSVETTIKKSKSFNQKKFQKSSNPSSTIKAEVQSQSSLGFQDDEEMKDDSSSPNKPEPSKIEEE